MFARFRRIFANARAGMGMDLSGGVRSGLFADLHFADGVLDIICKFAK